MFRRIVVATDVTAQSSAALRFARGFGQAFGSRITVAHVIPMPAELKGWGSAVFRADLKAYDDLLGRQIAAAEKEVARQVRVAGLTSSGGTRCIVRVGWPAVEIARLVDELDADLVIVARGRGGKLGPVAEQLVRLVGRTVLVAPVRAAKGATKALPSTAARPRRLRAAA